MGSLFKTFLYDPMYNALVFLVGVLPGEDIGFAIIILTLIIKFLLFPLAHKSTKAQKKMRDIEPEMRTIREKYKDDRQKQAELMLELYKKHGVNPFSGFLTLLLQIPIILALYFVFQKGLSFDPNIIYHFLTRPENPNFNFLGFIDLHSKSVYLAVLAGVTQYFQIKLATPPVPPLPEDGKLSFQEEFARNMSLQMKYVLPVMVLFIAYSLSSAIALYWSTSNLFAIGHELFVGRKAQEIKQQ